MELAIKQDASLEVLNTDLELDGDLAWNVAQLISDADDDVRLAKGKFWNACKDDNRYDICDAFGWKPATMKEYGQYANEIKLVGDRLRLLSYTHWRNARDSGIGAADRPEWLQRAADNQWTPKQLTDAVAEERRKRVDVIIEEGKKEGVFSEDTTAENYKEKSRQEGKKRAEEYGRTFVNAPPKTSTDMTFAEACEFVGLSPVRWIAKDTLDIIYRGYAKIMHSDTGNGNDNDMAKLNKAKEILKKVAK
jgi:hypothetical protein